jgi:preprotein translocase subunit SecD
MKRGYNRWLIPILILIAFAIWIDLPSNPGIHIGSFDRDIKIVQGLDLQGGLQILLEADLPPDEEVTSEQMQTARDIIERRVNALGVTEPLVQLAGSNRILVELPGIGNPEDAAAVIKETGLLEFIQITGTDLIAEGTIVQTDYGTSAEQDSSEEPAATAEPTPGTDEADTPDDTPPTSDRVYHTVMTGAIIQDAAVRLNPQTGSYVVGFDLTPDGSIVFGTYTSTHIGERLGIVLDKVIIAAPVISTAITEGSAIIEGDFTPEAANNLAVTLRYGSLPVPLTTVETKSVGPTLGQDSLQKSMIAGVVGLLIVMLFMALYYRLPGLLADLALLVYTLLTFALFKLIPVTLTLPGIAGFVLSIGVAVDANVLIFERMKEELRAGLRLRQAIDLGFSRAWPSIRDSNLSTLITCAILYWFGNTFGASIVKGFSLTLALGVLVSLFTAITVTRTFLHVVLDNIKIAEHPRWFGI